MSDSNQNDRTRLLALTKPVIYVLTITILLSLMTLNYYAVTMEEPPEVSPYPEDPDSPAGGKVQGALANALFYVIFAFIGGVFILILLRKGLETFIIALFSLIMGFSWFTFGLFYGTIVLFNILDLIWLLLPEIIQMIINDFLLNYYEMSIFVFSIFLGFLGLISFMIQKIDHLWVRNIMMVLFGSMVGSLLGIHFPLLSAFLVLVGISIYDIFAVFRGPLRGIIEHGQELSEEDLGASDEVNEELGQKEYQSSPLSLLPVYVTPVINIGLGDFAFFGMLTSVSVRIGSELNSIIPIIVTIIGIIIGIYVTFIFLTKKRAMPGLPFPVLIGILGLIISIFVTSGFDLQKIAELF